MSNAIAVIPTWAIMQGMLHLERLRTAIEALSQQARQHQQQAEAELTDVLRWLETAPSPAALRERTPPQDRPGEEAARPPQDLPLASRLEALDAPAPSSVIIGVDGSQIAPDRHALALYYVIQVGALIFRYNGQAPTPVQEAELHFAEHELFDPEGLLITGQLGMRRTVAEMRLAVALAEKVRAEGVPTPILTLTDGPLLWPYSGRSDEEARALLPGYFAAFDRLRELGALPAGFVERPGGRGLIELLWQSRLDESGSPQRQGERHPEAVDDELLMAHFLAPGERSVWLTRPSQMNERHGRHGHPIWFCYVNLGEKGFPVIARLEVPRWAAERDDWTLALHTTLLHQARLLNGNPYVLARAHELALVTHQDQAALESQLHRRLLERGLITRPSEKARQKRFF